MTFEGARFGLSNCLTLRAASPASAFSLDIHQPQAQPGKAKLLVLGAARRSYGFHRKTLRYCAGRRVRSV